MSLNEKALKAIYTPCKRCADALGYDDDAPKFASDKGLKRHLREVHNATSNERERFTL